MHFIASVWWKRKRKYDDVYVLNLYTRAFPVSGLGIDIKNLECHRSIKQKYDSRSKLSFPFFFFFFDARRLTVRSSFLVSLASSCPKSVVSVGHNAFEVKTRSKPTFYMSLSCTFRIFQRQEAFLQDHNIL